MKLAAIDIGTNTTRLLIAEPAGNRSLRTIIRLAKTTRLGEGVGKDHVFQPQAIERTLKVLKEYGKIIEREQAGLVKVVATSAARDARNVDLFLRQVCETGLEVEVLRGEQEAGFAFAGATRDADRLTGPTYHLVIDIGGGSTEFILGHEGRIDKKHSFDIGSVRLTEQFFHSDPPTRIELVEARLYIQDETITALLDLRTSPLVAIGVAGTVTTIAAVVQKMTVYDPEKIHHFRLTVSEIEEVLTLFLSLSLDERKKLPGLEPARADIIIAGTLILLESLQALGLNRLTVSEHDLLDGLILSLL